MIIIMKIYAQPIIWRRMYSAHLEDCVLQIFSLLLLSFITHVNTPFPSPYTSPTAYFSISMAPVYRQLRMQAAK